MPKTILNFLYLISSNASNQNQRQRQIKMERESEDYPQAQDRLNSSEETCKKPSKVKLVRRESSRLQNFLLKKIKFNGNGK